MCGSSIVQSNVAPFNAEAALQRFWWIPGSVRAAKLALPAGLDNLTPHLRRDIGLENRAAVHWSDATAYIDRGIRRP